MKNENAHKDARQSFDPAIQNQKPLNFDKIESSQKQETKKGRYVNEDQHLLTDPPVVDGQIRTSQDLDMFDISRGNNDSANRESRFTKLSKNRATGVQSRVSSRFS